MAKKKGMPPVGIRKTEIAEFKDVQINYSAGKQLRLMIEECLTDVKGFRYLDHFKKEHAASWTAKDIVVHQCWLCEQAERYISIYPSHIDADKINKMRELIRDIMMALRRGQR